MPGNRTAKDPLQGIQRSTYSHMSIALWGGHSISVPVLPSSSLIANHPLETWMLSQ